jgi:hypothetical protein
MTVVVMMMMMMMTMNVMMIVMTMMMVMVVMMMVVMMVVVVLMLFFGQLKRNKVTLPQWQKLSIMALMAVPNCSLQVCKRLPAKHHQLFKPHGCLHLNT